MIAELLAPVVTLDIGSWTVQDVGGSNFQTSFLQSSAVDWLINSRVFASYDSRENTMPPKFCPAPEVCGVLHVSVAMSYTAAWSDDCHPEVRPIAVVPPTASSLVLSAYEVNPS